MENTLDAICFAGYPYLKCQSLRTAAVIGNTSVNRLAKSNQYRIQEGENAQRKNESAQKA